MPKNPTVEAQELPGIPEGYRAVKVSISSGNSPNLNDSSVVNVIWSTAIKGKQASSIIVEKAKILSKEKVGSGIEVTLLCSSEDAKKIQLASVSGDLSLVNSAE